MAREFAPKIVTRTDRGKKSWRVEYYDQSSKRRRPSFSSKKSAQEFKKQLIDGHDTVGRKGAELLSNNRADAVNALEVLQPYNCSLTEAANHYINRYLKYKSNKSFNDYFQDLLTKISRKERSQRSVADLKSKNVPFLNKYGETQPKDLVPEEFVNWFWETAEDRDWTPRTMINYKSKISQLLKHAVSENGMELNHCEKLELPEVKDRVVEIYSIKECAKLLSAADDYGLGPYIALALFAGLRPEKEARYIKLENIHFDTNQLFVAEEISKRHSRSVDIHPTLQDWLYGDLPVADPILLQTNFRKRRENLAKENKVKWIYDGLRHTYGSMLYADKGDKSYVVDQMGHKGNTDIFDKHYKRLVTKDVAAEFWSLTPQKVKALVEDEKSVGWVDKFALGDVDGKNASL